MNSRAAIIRNLSDMFYLAAMKMEAQVTKLSRSILGFVNEDFLFGMCNGGMIPNALLKLPFRNCFKSRTADYTYGTNGNYI